MHGKSMKRRGLLVLALVAALAGCQDAPFPSSDELDQLRGMWRLLTPQPLPTNAYRNNATAVELGKALFGDPGLSSCGTVACANCHAPPSYAGDTAFATGCGGVTARNTPTLLNAAFREWFYWDGRKDSLWAHAILPLTRDLEMGATPASLRQHLQVDPGYVSQYTAIFGKAPGDELDDNRLLANFGKVMDAYVTTLVKVRAPFDDQLIAFTQKAEAGEDVSKEPIYLGLKTFLRKGKCIACHKGPNLSDDLFHNIGVDDHGTSDPGQAGGIDLLLADPFNGAGVYSDNPSVATGRLQAMQAAPREAMLGAFKTPSLRNVALTAPYMHTGQFQTLEDVIAFYNRGGDPAGTFVGQRTETIGKLDLTREERKALVDLLQRMTGTEEP